MATGKDDQGDVDAASATERIEREIDDARADLEARVDELAARRRAATDLFGQARRHPWAFVAAGVALIGGVVGAVIWRRRRPHVLASRLRDAIRTIV